MSNLKKMINLILDEGYTVMVESDGEVLYRGESRAEILRTLDSVDECVLRIATAASKDWALILPYEDEDFLADCKANGPFFDSFFD